MKFYRLAKHKFVLFALSVQLAALSLLPFNHGSAEAADDSAGFIIQADRVVGENMKAMIIQGETSQENAKPMLRIMYDSAIIYGMRLTKQFHSPGGMVSITMKADGPVRIKGMQVDTSAVSFKGACIHAEKIVPSAALEDVTMVAHAMNASDSSLEKLQLQTVNGDGGVQKPGQLEILKDLGSMPFEQMKKEIARITSGQLPLTCDGSISEEGGLGEAGKLLEEPLPDVLDKVRDGLIDGLPVEGTVGQLLDPVKGTIDQVLDPVKDTVNQVVSPVKDTVGKVTEPIKDATTPIISEVDKRTGEVKETVKKTVETAQPVVEPVEEVVEPVVKTACDKLEEADGKITKELGLELVDQALEEKKPLAELCADDVKLAEQLTKWNEGFLDSLGLLSLLAPKLSEEEQLKKMREAILKEPDGQLIAF